MTDHLSIEKKDGVLSIILNRPDKKNALTGEMYQGLVQAMRGADDDDDVRAILLSGAGGNYSAGSDISEFLSRFDKTGEFPALTFIKQIAICETPIVAAVSGNAIGVGTTMLLHCDLVYAAADARFHMPFINLALVPEAGSSLLVPARFGNLKAAELLLLGEPVDADGAKDLGLISGIVDSNALLDHARARAKQLADKPRNALRATRNLLRGNRADILARIDEESKAFETALRSDEARRVFQAFLNRKK